jgi:hypothetical protein
MFVVVVDAVMVLVGLSVVVVVFHLVRRWSTGGHSVEVTVVIRKLIGPNSTPCNEDSGLSLNLHT